MILGGAVLAPLSIPLLSAHLMSRYAAALNVTPQIERGKAGALELFGPARGLPRVISAHNNYHLWGPGDTMARVIIAVGSDREDLELVFTEVEQAATLSCDYCYHDGDPVWVARGLRIDIQKNWPMFREFS